MSIASHPLLERRSGQRRGHRRRLRAGVVLGLVLSSCAPRAAVDVGSPPPRPAVVAARPESRLRPLVGPGSKPSLFGIAAKLQLGMPMDLAQSAVPELFAPTPYRPPGLDDVQMKGQSDAYGRLGSVVVLLARKAALADVMNLWGEPTKGYDPVSRSDLYWWFDRNTRLRARLEDAPGAIDTSRLVIERYFPVSALLGDAPEHLFFEQDSLVGMTDDAAAQVYADYFPRNSSNPSAAAAPTLSLCASQVLVMPPVEYDAAFTRVRIWCRAHTIISFEILMSYKNYFALKDEVLRLLRNKYGAPAAEKGVVDYHAQGLRIRFVDSVAAKEVVIQVSSHGAPE